MFTEEKMTVNNNRDLKGNSLIECIDNYTVIDIETTGLDPKINKIIELAALKVQDNQVIDTFSCLINPEVEIDNFITKLTGISQDMVKDAPVLDDVLQKFLDFIGEDVIIGHNVNFDINFIYDNSMLLLNKAVENNYIDTLRISRLNNNVENHKLQTMANYYNIDYTNAHRALKDCYITKELYSCLKNEISKTNEQRNKIVDNFVIPKENPFFNKKIVIKGVIKNYGYEFIEKIALKCKEYGVKVVVNSGAHMTTKIGDHGVTLKMMEEIGKQKGLVINASVKNLKEYFRNRPSGRGMEL